MSIQNQNRVSASICPLPFKQHSEQISLPVGLSVSEVMGRYAPLGVLHNAHVFIDGEPVERDLWSTTLLREGQQIDIRVVPTGGGQGGKDALRTVMSLAVMTTAFGIGGWGGIAGWGKLGKLAPYAALGFAGGGALAVGAMLAPPSIPEEKREDPVYSITGQQNRANPYGAIPKVYGQMRVFPPLAAMPYTEILGNDEYLNILFALYGPLKLSDFKLGDEGIENYDVEVAYCEGHADCTDCDQYDAETGTCAAGWGTDGTPTGSDIYSDTIYEQQIEEELEYEAGAGWHMHETYADADAGAISIDILFPGGLYGYDSDGVRTNQSTTTEMRYMKKLDYEAAGTDWLPSDDPTVEQLCPDFDEWSAGGGATYSADIDGSGNPGFTLDADGEYAQSGFIRVYNPSEFDFIADFYSDVADPEYTVEVEYYSNAVQAWGFPIENDDGDTVTEIDGGFTQSTWDEETETFTGGGRVRYVRLKIKYNSDTPGEYKFRLPKIVTYKSFITTANTTRLLRKSFRWEVADPDEYVVQVRRADTEATGSDVDIMYWSTLRTIVKEDPITFSGNLAQVAMRIKATGALSGTVDRFSVLASSVLPVYSEGSWTPTETANPAWCFCDALRSAANANAVADSRLNLTALGLWASACTTKPFNGMIDKQMPLYEVLKTIASVGRASPTMLDGTYSTVQDAATATISQHFTPRNSWGFKGGKSFVDIPHGLKLKFFNEDEDYVQDEVIYYHPDYTASTATRFQTINLMGITDPDQAYEEGRYHMASMILRPEVFTLQADIEHIVCTRGDRVKVTHDVPLIGLGYGRLTSVTDTGGGIYELGLDSAVTMVTGSNYRIRIRYATGTTSGIDVVNENDTVSTVTTQAALGTAPAVGDLFMFGIRGYESLDCVVQSVVPGPDMSATLTLVEYNVSILAAGTIPEHTSNITVQPDPHRTPPVPIVESVSSDEDAMYEIAPGVYESQILLALRRVSGAVIKPHDIHVQYRETDSGEAWRRLPVQPAEAASVSVRPVEDGLDYDVRLRYVSEYGRASEWTYVNAHTVIGKSTVPDDIDTMVYQPSGRLEWDYTPPRDFAGFKVRYNDGENTTWSNGTPAHGGYIQPTFFDISGFASGTTTWMVKAYDTAGNESAGCAYVVKDIGDPVSDNVVQTIDYDAGGYPGSLTDCTVATGDLYADEETSLFYHGDTTLFYDRPTLFYGSTYNAMSYVMPFYPYVSTHVGSDLWLDYTATGLDDAYYRITEPTDSDDFSGDLSKWGTPSDGTWAIASGALTAEHDPAGGYNQTMMFDDWTGTAGDKYYIYFRVKNDDVSEARFGFKLRGAYYAWDQTQHEVGGAATDNSDAMADDTYQAWLFEVLADGTINWYVDGELLDTGTAASSSGQVDFLVQEDATTTRTTTFDDFKIWEPSSNWIIWPGKIRTDTDELYEIRFRSLAGATRGVITDLETNLDLPDIVEYHNDFACAVTTGTRLTLAKTYTSITNVIVTVQSSGAETAITAKADDKQNTAGANNGPLIKCYDSGGNVVAGHVDVRVKGY